MPRIALGLQYDGQAYQGWQSQPNGQTVQDTLERALHKFAVMPVSVQCAGRTDTGVHALGQVVHFDVPIERENTAWVRGVNAFLPDTIAVLTSALIITSFITMLCVHPFGLDVQAGITDYWMQKKCMWRRNHW